MTDIKPKYLGGMIGSALGDAIGELAFHSRSKEALSGQLEKLKELSYTDDTAMSIGIAETIVKKGYLDPQELGERFRHNFQKEPWRGYGPGPPTIFSMVENLGFTSFEAAKALYRGQGSFGNGAAMRVVPVGLFFHNSPNLYEEASASAAVTHAHPIGKDGAAVQAKAISLAFNLDPEEPFPTEVFINSLINFARTPEMKEKLLMVQQLIAAKASPSQAADHLGRSVEVHKSLPFALYSFLRHPESFEGCLFCAALHGGDRDTLGAMACAASGAYLGIESAPLLWRQKLENLAYIKSLAIKLSETEPA